MNETIFRVRAIILNWDEILLVRHKWRGFFSLPWWKVDPWEKVKIAMERELFEELWVKAEIWKMLFSHEFTFENNREWETWTKNNLEFFFEIKNPKDFIWKSWDFAELELDEIKWFKISEIEDLKPIFLKEKLLNWLENIQDNFFAY